MSDNANGEGGDRVFGNISLGTRGGASTGSLKLNTSGLVWKRSSGGRSVEVPAEEITGFQWIKLPRNYMLLVKRNEAPALSFIGFGEANLAAIKSAALGDVEEVPLAISGHNWGNIELNGASIVFKVGGKPSFVIPLPDVTQVTQGREEVLVQFPMDDSAAGDREDSLVEVGFHIPKECADFPPPVVEVPDGTEAPVPIPACKILYDIIGGYTDIGAGAGDAIVTFDSVGVLIPRGRFDVELFSSSLKLVGQAQDYRVQYDSIQRIFVLPRSNAPQTYVAVCLDPPIRKGQTFYTTILCQFHNDEETTVELDISQEALAAKNEKGAKLSKSMTGSSPDVFAKVVRGLSGAKLTRPGTFKDSLGEGFAVRCSYKSDDGYLYPLERAFFYVQKPPLLMSYDDVESVEFQRQAVGITAAKTFDLSVRMRNGQEHLFRSIPRSEWANLFDWIQAKQLRIDNFKEAQRGPGAAPTGYSDALPGGVDAGMAAQAALGSDSEQGDSEDEEDEDFAAAASDSSSGDDDSDDDEGGEGGGGGSGAVKTVAEDEGGEPKKKKAKTEKKEKPKKGIVAAAGGGDGGKPAKKARKKKDKDAPKKALSAFMFFSAAKREQVKTENPGIAFGDVGKKLGEMWKACSADDKAPFDAQAEEDKGRYALAMEEYRKKKAGGEDGGGGAGAAAGSDDDDGDNEGAAMEIDAGSD